MRELPLQRGVTQTSKTPAAGLAAPDRNRGHTGQSSSSLSESSPSRASSYCSRSTPSKSNTSPSSTPYASSQANLRTSEASKMTGVRCQTHLDVGCGATPAKPYTETLHGLTTPPQLRSRRAIGTFFIVCVVTSAALILRVADPFDCAGVVDCEGQPFRARAVRRRLSLRRLRPRLPVSGGSPSGEGAGEYNTCPTATTRNPTFVWIFPRVWPV